MIETYGYKKYGGMDSSFFREKAIREGTYDLPAEFLEKEKEFALHNATQVMNLYGSGDITRHKAVSTIKNLMGKSLVKYYRPVRKWEW
jgi:hypothetical protein